jgi:SAM-dependent methyltransferase
MKDRSRHHGKPAYPTRISFVTDRLRRSHLSAQKIVDVGFIGEYERAEVHYAIVDNLASSDSLVGIDVDEKKMNRFLSNPRTKLLQGQKNLEYRVMSVFETDFKDNTFDFVLLLEVLEHLRSPYLVFNEIYRILKPGGSVIITYPNPLEIGKLMRYIFQKDLLNVKYLDNFRGMSEHKVFPHPVCLAIYLNDIGFRVDAVEFIKCGFRCLDYMFQVLRLLFRLENKFSSYVGVAATKK